MAPEAPALHGRTSQGIELSTRICTRSGIDQQGTRCKPAGLIPTSEMRNSRSATRITGMAINAGFPYNHSTPCVDCDSATWMAMLRILISLLFAVALLQSAAPGQADDVAAFSAGLDALRIRMNQGKWRTTLDRLKTLLESHANRNYVRAYRLEIELLHRRCAFQAAVKPTDPKTLVSGELLACDVATGKMRMRYTPASLEGDFRRNKNDYWIHEPDFMGPFTLTFKGDRYPGHSPRIFLCVEENTRYYYFLFSLHKEGGTASLYLCREDDKTLQKIQKKIPPGRSKARYTLRITVGAGSITARLNGLHIATFRKTGVRFGTWYFRFNNFAVLLVDGEVQPSWMQGKIDAVLQKKRQAFEKKYDLRKHLPSWLYSPSEENPETWEQKVFPGPYSSGQLRLYNRLFEEIVYRSPEYGLEQLQKKSDRLVHPLARRYLTALYYRRIEDYPKALAQLDLVLEGQPGFEVGQFVKTDILAGIGKRTEAIEILQDLTARSPEYPHTYRFLADLLLKERRIEEARRTLAKAYTQLANATELDD